MTIPFQVGQDEVKELLKECSNQTMRYAVAMIGLTALGITAIIVDGDIGNTIAIAVAAGIGYLVKDYRGGESHGQEESEQKA